MMSLLWYYRPEHTEQGRTPADQPDEVFASRHKDSNSVACIDDKCYVLTFHEYCRYVKNNSAREMNVTRGVTGIARICGDWKRGSRRLRLVSPFQNHIPGVTDNRLPLFRCHQTWSSFAEESMILGKKE